MVWPDYLFVYLSKTEIGNISVRAHISKLNFLTRYLKLTLTYIFFDYVQLLWQKLLEFIRTFTSPSNFLVIISTIRTYAQFVKIILLGIEKEIYTKMFYQLSYYENIPADLDEIYLFHYGLIVCDYISYELKELVGKSLHILLRFVP